MKRVQWITWATVGWVVLATAWVVYHACAGYTFVSRYSIHLAGVYLSSSLLAIANCFILVVILAKDAQRTSFSRRTLLLLGVTTALLVVLALINLAKAYSIYTEMRTSVFGKS
ncbi:MAG: hypothetical protein KatS3mg023_0161 [Armatimonadota bacterium]|nr:MAG: hypothetical protein KatS3mg023_0161 [Armatimonadota bacterium]